MDGVKTPWETETTTYDFVCEGLWEDDAGLPYLFTGCPTTFKTLAPANRFTSWLMRLRAKRWLRWIPEWGRWVEYEAPGLVSVSNTSEGAEETRVTADIEFIGNVHVHKWWGRSR